MEDCLGERAKNGWRAMPLARSATECRVSRIAESQVSDATIMALAGHLSVKMKERYSHVRAEAKRQAVASLDIPQTEGRSAAIVQ